MAELYYINKSIKGGVKMIKEDYMERGLRKCRFSMLFYLLYGVPLSFSRKIILKLVTRLEGGRFYSFTLRKILSNLFGIDVGAYSYGPCLVPGAFPSGVKIGRYVSIASGVKIFLRNHPILNLSLHPFFYNSIFGYLDKDTIQCGTLEIGHDAWIGENAIIVPGCSRIGIGAIIGAGAVVTKDVPDFAIVAGTPSKLIRSRFDLETIALILDSEWWLRTIEEIIPDISSMTVPLSNIGSNHPLLRKYIPKIDKV